VVSQISCGESHAALVATNGKVYSWGNGEHGALGHGNKQNQPTPKAINSLSTVRVISVSCGQYHTAFVAGAEEDISYVRIPSAAAAASVTPSLTSADEKEEEESDRLDSHDHLSQNTLICASLYTCGLGKAGQLGHGQSIAMIRTPQLVSWFVENGYKVSQASCGMHHTAVLCVPIHAMRVFTTNIFTFGWGEHGRLGLGSEDGALEPMMVQFPEPFHGIHISAGEQHTVATSGRVGGCYAWGNNEFGQCGVGTTANQTSGPGGGGGGGGGANAACFLSPTKVALPEGVRSIRVYCGGRHTAVLSHDNQVYIWGWGEEGQLGNGTEKDSNLPKPCRLPSVVMGVPSSPSVRCVDVSLGMCHTVILTQNMTYRPPTPPPTSLKTEPPSVAVVVPIAQEPDPPVEPPPPPIEISPIEEPIVVIERVPITPIEVLKKEGILISQEVQEPPPVITPVPIRSLKDLLSAREERRSATSVPLSVPVPLSLSLSVSVPLCLCLSLSPSLFLCALTIDSLNQL
jgi:alpha-tubulin suppressor-like RCC1 family protein